MVADGLEPPARQQPRGDMMETMRKVNINVQPPYTAVIQAGLLSGIGDALGEFGEQRRCFVITTANIRKHVAAPLQASLQAREVAHDVVEFGDGEQHKTLRTVETLAAALVKRGADRKSLILALGGGVVGDVAGFVASVYMRGVDLIHVPTTFLAQVDSGIGGKTGVNLPAGKNLLGTFYQPRAVLIDPAVLSTLPEREYRAGLYEALKVGIIRAPRIFAYMEENRSRILQRDAEALEWLIAECVDVKAGVVAADEREGDLRRVLNFGHTLGHALEAETRYRQFLHGEAVAWGMIGAAMIGVAMQKTDPEVARKIISSVLAYAPLPRVTVRSKAVVKRLTADKKALNGRVHFILPVEIGKVEITPDVPERAVLQAVEELRYLSQV